MKRVSIAVGLCVAAVSTASAQPSDVDVGVVVEGGRLVTGEYIDPPGTLTPGARVFGGDMDLIAGSVFGDEPGFRALAGTFPSDGTLSIQFRRALRVWSGGNFNTLSTPVLLNVQLNGGATSVFSPPTDPADPDTAVLSGFSFAVLGGAELHEHGDLFLVSPGATPPPVPEGIYLAEFQLTTNVPGIDRSLPFWMVFNYGMPAEEHDAAMDYVRNTLVPAPGSCVVGAFVAWAARRRRR